MLFKLGDTIVKNDQTYRVVNFQPYIKYDGSQIELACFVSCCADCGQAYEFKLPQGAMKFEPKRRCDKHKKPGVKVKTTARKMPRVRPVSNTSPSVFD